MKLYWRLKKKGKWTWRPARYQVLQLELRPGVYEGKVVVIPEEEE